MTSHQKFITPKEHMGQEHKFPIQFQNRDTPSHKVMNTKHHSFAQMICLLKHGVLHKCFCVCNTSKTMFWNHVKNTAQ